MMFQSRMRPGGLLKNKWTHLFNVIPAGIHCTGAPKRRSGGDKSSLLPAVVHSEVLIDFIWLVAVALWFSPGSMGSTNRPNLLWLWKHDVEMQWLLAAAAKCLPADRWDESLMIPVWKLGQRQREQTENEENRKVEKVAMRKTLKSWWVKTNFFLKMQVFQAYSAYSEQIHFF